MQTDNSNQDMKLYREHLISKLYNKTDTRLLDNYFLNPNVTHFGVIECFNEPGDLYYTESEFDSGLCIVDGMSAVPSVQALMSLIEEKKPRDVYFVENYDLQEALAESFDLYRVNKVLAHNFSNIEFVNDYIILYLAAPYDRIIMKACLKQELRNV
jgi:hypothetical protein